MLDNFFKPATIKEALILKDKYKNEAQFFAGGTQINSRDSSEAKKYSISIEDLDLNNIIIENKEIIFGSTSTMQDLIDSDLIPESIKTASKYMTNRNIRNMATVGGNIAANRSCSNLIPILIALKAKLKITTLTGDRLIDMCSYIDNTQNGLIVDIIIPYTEKRIVKLNRFTRSANDLAILNIAVSFTKKPEQLSDICIAVGGIDKHVKRLSKIEERLNSSKLPPKEKIEKLIQNNIDPIDDIRGSAKFKSSLTGVMVSDCFYSALTKEGM